jgi:hypothetical protein
VTSVRTCLAAISTWFANVASLLGLTTDKIIPPRYCLTKLEQSQTPVCHEANTVPRQVVAVK